jgi:nitrate/TMAO reductase-like tetraheme cytochrome c subunit
VTGAVLERPVPLPGRASARHGATLEELLTSALRRVHANGSTECPVCHAEMSSVSGGAREAGARAAARAAECGSCGSRLS